MINKIKNTKINKKTKVILSSVFLFFSFVTLFFISVAFVGEKHEFSEVFRVLFTELTNPKATSEVKSIQNTIWIILAMMIGGMGLAVTGAVSQSLTKNPLADASTLGTINATVFLLIISLSIGLVSFSYQYIFAMIGGGVSAFLLLGILLLAKGKFNKGKIILIGLALSIAFKTLAFFFWRVDKCIGGAFSAYTIGGSERIIGMNTYMSKP